MNKHTIKGEADIAKGKLKQGYGKATDDDEAYAEGQGEEAKGHLKKGVGEAKDTAEKKKADL